SHSKASASPNTLSILFSTKILIVIFIIAILHGFQAGFSGMFISIYFLDELRAPALLIGVVFGTATLAGTIAAHYAGKIGKSRGFKEILIVCYFGYLFAWGSFFLSTDNYVLPAISYIFPIYVGLLVAGPALVSDHIPESRRGTFMGIFGTCQNLGFAVGSIFGGMFAGLQQSFRLNFGVSAVFSLLIIVSTILFVKNEKK
ncbi:MAG: MFS transporter, partial [Candidatus Hodarchaeales archaeon]